MSQSKRERLVLAITFGLTNVALFLFAILPLDTVIWAETLVAAGASVATTLVALNVSDRAHKNPVVQRGYLITGAVALFTMLAFIFSGDSAAASLASWDGLVASPAQDHALREAARAILSTDSLAATLLESIKKRDLGRLVEAAVRRGRALEACRSAFGIG